MIKQRYALISIAVTLLLNACAGPIPQTSSSVPSGGAVTTRHRLPADAQRSSSSSGNWGVASNGYVGWSEAWFAYCDTTIFLYPGWSCGTPSNPDAYLYGQRSMKVTLSQSITCPDEYGSPTCSGILSAKPMLGKLIVSNSSSATSGGNLDSVQSSYFLDQITVTSSTLPNGTPVKIKETVSLTGASNIDCLGGKASGSYTVYPGVSADPFPILTGSCSSGIPISPVKASKKFASNVGATFSVAPDVDDSLTIHSGPDSPSMQLKVVYHLKSVTPNVTLVSASGTVY